MHGVKLNGNEQYRSFYSILLSNNFENTFKRRNIKILHNNIVSENGGLKLCIDLLSTCIQFCRYEATIFEHSFCLTKAQNINVLITIITSMMTCNFSCIFYIPGVT